LHLIIFFELQECCEKPMFHLQSQWSPETLLLPVCSAWETSARKLHWEIVWRNAPRIWWDFGSALPIQTRLTQTKPVLPLSNEHGSQIKDQGRLQCSHNKHKKFPIGLHVMYLYFPETSRKNLFPVHSRTAVCLLEKSQHFLINICFYPTITEDKKIMRGGAKCGWFIQ
jgi:hypothetical protein